MQIVDQAGAGSCWTVARHPQPWRHPIGGVERSLERRLDPLIDEE
jgi:hypothetical protein